MSIFARILLAVATAFAVPVSAAPIITSPELQESSYITFEGLDWTWASVVSSSNFASNVLEAPSYREGWRFATVEEFANRPDASAFLDGNGGVINSVPYWNSVYGSVSSGNYDNGVNGLIARTIDSPDPKFWEIWYVRDSVVAGSVPEPSTWAMLLLGFFCVGGMMRARTRPSVSYAF